MSYRFSGSYENQIRAQKTLSVVLPLALFLIFLILYFQFKQVPTTLLVFSGIIVAWAGGFLMIWAYGQDWFLDFAVFGVNMRDLFQVHPINLSVAIWVGLPGALRHRLGRWRGDHDLSGPELRGGADRDGRRCPGRDGRGGACVGCGRA